MEKASEEIINLHNKLRRRRLDAFLLLTDAIGHIIRLFVTTFCLLSFCNVTSLTVFASPNFLLRLLLLLRLLESNSQICKSCKPVIPKNAKRLGIYAYLCIYLSFFPRRLFPGIFSSFFPFFPLRLHNFVIKFLSFFYYFYSYVLENP
jgi:hypothetical protein